MRSCKSAGIIKRNSISITKQKDNENIYDLSRPKTSLANIKCIYFIIIAKSHNNVNMMRHSISTTSLPSNNYISFEKQTYGI